MHRFLIPALLLAAMPAKADMYFDAAQVAYSSAADASCTPRLRSITTRDIGNEIWLQYENQTANWLAFQGTITFSGNGVPARSIIFATNNTRPPGNGVVRIVGVSPALPSTIPGAQVTVRVTYCSASRPPSGPPRNIY